mgnify:CR=1 FL=1
MPHWKKTVVNSSDAILNSFISLNENNNSRKIK